MKSDCGIEYQFCGYRLDVRHRKLFDPHGALVILSARPLDALLCLVEHHGQVLSRETLMEVVWPQLYVEENNLTQAISTIRKALHDNACESQFIRTVPGHGYCFTATVEKHVAGTAAGCAPPSTYVAAKRALTTWPRLWLTQAVALALAVGMIAGIATWRGKEPVIASPANTRNLAPLGMSSVPRPQSRIPNSIAVLPLATLSPEYDPMFTSGLHDEIISQLTKNRSLNVIARSSIIALLDDGSSTLDLARVLRVESILTGTLRLAGTHARISLQLLDVGSGLMMWSGTYDIDQQDLGEMISLQGDIALNVATALKAEIPNPPSVDFAALSTELLKAHRFNLAARTAQSHQKYAEAWRLAQRSIALAPDFYDALDTFTALNVILIATPLPGMNSRMHAELALEHANRMIALAPVRTEGYALKAAVLAAGKDWSGAAAALDIVDDMNAPQASLEFIGLVLLALGDFERAAEIYEATLVTDLINPYARGLLMTAHELTGNTEMARDKFAVGQELYEQWWGENVDVVLALGRNEAPRELQQLAISEELKAALAQTSNAAAVRAALDEYRASRATNPLEALYFAALAARLGEHGSAVDLLRRVTEDVGSWLFWAWLPVFDATRREPEFRQLLRDVGIVAYWEKEGWPRMCHPAGADFRCDWSASPSLMSAAF
jgi:DNA-binding winged helix-turn-helix (wHTH) protein/TolB-like protein